MKKLLRTTIHKTAIIAISLVAIGLINACVEEELPGAGSIPDEIPPSANFSYASDPEDFRITKFTNLSTESLSFLWDFGGGNTSTEKDPTFTFEEEGKYPVKLTATDGLGVSNDVTIDVAVEEGPYQPIILESGFEDGQLEGGSGDGRDSWKNDDLGGVIQITASPVASGVQAAKLPGGGDKRIGYQEIVVEPETNYDINFIYTMKDDVTGYITMDILDVVANGGTFTSHEDAQAALLGSVSVNDQEDPETYVSASVSFASGTSSKVAIYFYNGGVTESRLDDITIEIGRSGAVAPSASFVANQSESNYLEYTFTNGSHNAASYLWDFGDGNTSTEVTPTHVYDVASVYSVSLTATSEGGLTGEFKSEIDIQAPVTAGFTFEVDAIEYNTIHFTDTSVDAVMLLWEFGDGYQFTGINPSHTYDEDGAYTVTLTASSITGLTSVHTEQIAITAGAIIPVITNGDFDDSSAGWKLGDCTGCSTSAFNGSSDGSWYDYAGTLGTEKTPGAKYTISTSAGEYKSSDTRYAYQALDVTPNTVYILEYEYAIKDDTDGITEPAGGRRVVAEILDGHFDDGADAAVQSEAGDALVTSIGTIAEGKFSDTVGTRVTVEFTSNDSGEIAIWLWAVTPVDAWFDNIKVYPKD